jgi:hypothetical protein
MYINDDSISSSSLQTDVMSILLLRNGFLDKDSFDSNRKK